MRLYVAGGMSGYPHWNFPQFDLVAKHLRSLGHDVVNPAELDSPKIREEAFASDKPLSRRKDYARLLARDLAIIGSDRVEAIVVLPGWHKSTGARVETFYAHQLGKPILYLTLRRVPRSTLHTAWLGR